MSYITSLINTCGFPHEIAEVLDLEEAIVTENTSRVSNIMKDVEVHLGELSREK